VVHTGGSAWIRRGRRPRAGATFAATRLSSSVGDWCIGNTVVSKTAASGSTPGSPVARSRALFPRRARIYGAFATRCKLRLKPLKAAGNGSALQRNCSGAVSAEHSRFVGVAERLPTRDQSGAAIAPSRPTTQGPSCTQRTAPPDSELGRRSRQQAGGRAIAGSNPVSPIQKRPATWQVLGRCGGRAAGATGSKRGPIVDSKRAGERLGCAPWQPGKLGCAELRRLGSGFAGRRQPPRGWGCSMARRRVGRGRSSLKIVVSPVRVWVSPFLKSPACGLVLTHRHRQTTNRPIRTSPPLVTRTRQSRSSHPPTRPPRHAHHLDHRPQGTLLIR
jgi:hypothetical protein